MGKPQKTNNQFLKEVFNLVKNEYEVLSEYQTSQVKLKFYHKACKHTFKMTPNRFLMGNRCPFCAGSMKKTTEEFKKEVCESTKGEYELVSEYETCHKKVNIKHNECGNIYSVRPNDFQQGKRCPKCSHRSYKLTNSDFQEKLENKFPNEYLLVGNYVNVKTKIKLKHLTCNTKFYTYSNYLVKNCLCPVCGSGFVSNFDNIQKRIDLISNNYKLIDIEKGILTLEHLTCNNIYKVRLSGFFSNGNRCPICIRKERESRGIKKIKKFLITNNINFEQEITFDECVYINQLYFDFCIELKDQRYLLIEFDGEQHYKPKFGRNTLLKQQKRDHIKNEWSRRFDVVLIRIPYNKEKNIPLILRKTFNDYPVREYTAS